MVAFNRRRDEVLAAIALQRTRGKDTEEQVLDLLVRTAAASNNKRGLDRAQKGFTFRNFLTDVFAVFMFVLWFWLLITIFSDLFRRRDLSGWVKAIWVIALIVLPYIGIFVYLIT